MNFLLEGSFFSNNWVLIVVVVVAIGLLILTSFTRRKKEEQYRNDLDSKIVAGAKVKTYSGLYATVVSIRNTTDGKIVLIETGEGDKKSYQQLHINAIFGIDESEDMVINAEGVEVPMSELNKPKEVEAEVVEEKVEEETKVEEEPKATEEVENTVETEEIKEEAPVKEKKTKKSNK